MAIRIFPGGGAWLDGHLAERGTEQFGDGGGRLAGAIGGWRLGWRRAKCPVDAGADMAAHQPTEADLYGLLTFGGFAHDQDFFLMWPSVNSVHQKTFQ